MIAPTRTKLFDVRYFAEYVNSRLRIHHESGGIPQLPGESFGNYEIILPPLPEQKWTMITISKKDRQIFVYYNSTLVLSKKALHTFSIVPPASQMPAYAGDTTLSGTIAMVAFYPSHQTTSDVTTTYGQMVDTRGNLNTLQAVPTSSSYTVNDTSTWGIINTLCLDGSCFLNRSVAPKIVPTIPSIYSPLETSYA